MLSNFRQFAHRVPITLAAVFFAVTISPAGLLSQAAGTLSGTVTAANKLPVAQARVRVLGTELATTTRTDGAFDVARVPAGRQELQVLMVGFTPAAMVIEIVAGDTLKVSVVLEPIPLEPVTISADRNFFVGMAGFEERKARGSGRYFTRDDIKLMQPRQLTDVLRRVPGMQIETVVGGLSGGSPTARTGRNISGANSPCVMAYYVNGSPLPVSSDISINHFVAADDVAAMEVYTGSSQIPPEFNSSLYGARCGVVAIWTRSSLDAKTSR
ncbi:MAG: carboxypeptidase regulatory-like domain-containing protein [Gemmatimonadaceae bacterium]